MHLCSPYDLKWAYQKNDVLALLDYEEDLSDKEKQVKLWFMAYVKLLAKGNVRYYFMKCT